MRAVRRASLLVAFVIVFGCSSLSSITAYNDSDLPIDLKVSDEEGETWRGRIDPHSQAQVWRRFGGPTTLKFEVGHKAIGYAAETLPPWLARAGSGGIQAHWYWDGRQTRFEADELSNVDRFFRNALMLGGSSVIAAGIGIASLLRRRARATVKD